MVKKIVRKELEAVLKKSRGLYQSFIEEEIPEPERVLEWTSKGRKPRILVLYTGGTLGMEPVPVGDGSRKVLRPSLSLEKLMETADIVTGIRGDFDFLGYRVSHIDSTEINVSVWKNLAKLVEEHYDGVNGVVVLHGTDTLAYTSAALAFSLRNLAIPVVSTGAQMILRRPGTDVIGNLTGSIAIAGSRLAGSSVYFDGNIYNGTRVEKRHDHELQGFDSPIYGRIGTLGANGIVLGKEAMVRGEHATSDLIYDPVFATSVMEVVLSPVGDPGAVAQAALDKECKAIVLRSYGPGNAPRWYVPLIEYLTTHGMPVYITSQCSQSGISEQSHYGPGDQIAQSGGVQVGDLSPQAAVTKLMNIMAHTDDVAKVNRQLVETDYAGEITLAR